MISTGIITDLVNQKEEIFEKAGELAHEKRVKLSSPLVLTRDCKLSPLCKHCSWRANKHLMEYYSSATINKFEAVSRAIRIQQSGMDCVHLVSGWMGKALPKYFFECIEGIKAHTNIELTAAFGAINRADIISLKEVGVNSISCALETTNRKVFSNLKPCDSYVARLRTLQDAVELGFKISTGFLIGIGESIEDIDSGIRLTEELKADFLTITSIQPTPFTETENWDRPKPYLVARIAAATRIVLPEVDIAASFGCDTYTDMAWAMKSGINAFMIPLRNPQETPELMGDEAARINLMWNEYRVKKREIIVT